MYVAISFNPTIYSSTEIVENLCMFDKVVEVIGQTEHLIVVKTTLTEQQLAVIRGARECICICQE